MEKVLEEVEKLINIYAEMNRFIVCREIMEEVKEKDIQEKFKNQKEKVISAIEEELQNYKEEKDIEESKTKFSLLVELCNKIEEVSLEDDKNMQNEIIKLQYIYKNRNNKTLAEEIEDFSAEEIDNEFNIDNSLELSNMELQEKENVANKKTGNKKDKNKVKNRKSGSKLQIIYDAEKEVYLVKDNMDFYSIKPEELDKETEEKLTDEQYKEFKQKTAGFSNFNGGDKNIAYILYKYDIENNTEKFQKYLNVINSPLEDEEKKRLSIRIRTDIVYDLRKMYNDEINYTRDERMKILDIANKAKKTGIAKTMKSIKTLIIEPIDRIIYNYNRHVILAFEKSKIPEIDGYKVDVTNLEDEKNVEFNTQKVKKQNFEKTQPHTEENDTQIVKNDENIEKVIWEKVGMEYAKYRKEQEEQEKMKAEQLKKYNENLERNKAYFEKQKQKSGQAKWENGNIVSENIEEQKEQEKCENENIVSENIDEQEK